MIPRALSLAVLACATLPAMAQSPSPSPSATWFADNPGPRNRILDLCREHPGPAERDDRCKAAFEGAGIAAAREARRSRGDLTPPTSLKYWIDNPEERREHLATCKRVPADVAERLWCTQAREAERQVRDAERRAEEREQQPTPQSRPTRPPGRT
jgi:hypothetical protein